MKIMIMISDSEARALMEICEKARRADLWAIFLAAYHEATLVRTGRANEVRHEKSQPVRQRKGDRSVRATTPQPLPDSPSTSEVIGETERREGC